MCNPVAALAVTEGVVKAGSAIAGHAAQAKAASANEKAANASYLQTVQALNVRGSQEQDAAKQSIMQADRAARAADAVARVSAGEAGVAGASVDAVLTDLARRKAEATQITDRNLGATLDQLTLARQGANAERVSRIAGVPQPNPFLTGLQLVGAGVDTATTLYNYNHPTPGKG